MNDEAFPSKSEARERGAFAGACLAMLGASAAVLIWLWLCWCVFPARGWNDIRLAPVFGLKLGQPLYPVAHGPASTWAYGPLPILALWPATWARDAGTALLIAGAINLAVSLGAILAACLWWPTGTATRPSLLTRVSAVLMCAAIWPGAAWQYLQADNFAVALGRLANLVLVNSASPRGRRWAAWLAVSILLAKQTLVAVPIAQVLWLGVTEGRKEAWHHCGRCLLAAAVLGGALILGFGWGGVWLNLVALPSHYPWYAPIRGRLADLAPFFLVHFGVPAGAWLALRRTAVARTLHLPMLTWLITWLPDLASLLKLGGSINNLHGLQLCLPPILVSLGAVAESRTRSTLPILAAALLAVAACAWRSALLPGAPWRPQLELYREAAVLAAGRTDQIWFPWHPLVTVFSDHRLYAVEDGLYVRSVSGRPLTYGEVRRDLPARLSAIAVPRAATTWGIALALAPPGARHRAFGLWSLTLWPPEPVHR